MAEAGASEPEMMARLAGTDPAMGQVYANARRLSLQDAGIGEGCAPALFDGQAWIGFRSVARCRTAQDQKKSPHLDLGGGLLEKP